jgi:ADP-dependent NAD(P)H-hydrate dehydratase
MRQLHHAEGQMTGRVAALDAALLRSWPLPLDENGDKLSRGTVLVIAGSTTTAGAALLAGTAALRMGAGRLQIATAAPVAVGLSIAMPEAMVLPLPVDGDQHLLADDGARALTKHLAEAQAVLVGPGMSGLPAICAILKEAATAMAPDAVLVADAAALEGLATLDREVIRPLAKRLLLTPNRQELDTLAEGLASPITDEDPAAGVARELGAVVTCFGELTSFDGSRWSAERATPGLGTSGSGDVLAGLAVGAGARCGDPAQAACWATYVHGVAGNRLSQRVGTTSFLARELLDEVPHVLATLD